MLRMTGKVGFIMRTYTFTSLCRALRVQLLRNIHLLYGFVFDLLIMVNTAILKQFVHVGPALKVMRMTLLVVAYTLCSSMLSHIEKGKLAAFELALCSSLEAKSVPMQCWS